MQHIIQVTLFVIGSSVVSVFGQGFFAENRVPRPIPNFSITESVKAVEEQSTVSVTLLPDQKIAPVLPTLFGNNTVGWLKENWVNDSVIVARMKDAGISYLRLPGGNWSNAWFWDGTIPDNLIEDRTPLQKEYAGDGSDWTLASDLMIQMAENIGAEAQICVNYAYARYGGGEDPVAEAAHYAAEWVRHVNDTLGAYVRYWEIGNENYGKWQQGYIVNGDTITGAEYGAHFRVFADSMKAADPSIKIGAVLHTQDGFVSGTHDWNAGVLPEVQEHADYLIIHEYFTWSADINDVTVDEMIDAMSAIGDDKAFIQSMVAQHTDKSPDYFPIAMTEYNVRAGTKNSSHISALLIAKALGEFITHGYGLVNIWDVANGWNEDDGDHGMFARKDPRVDDYTPHPSFYTYYYATQFLGDSLIDHTQDTDNNLSIYPTLFSDQSYGIMVINPSDTKEYVTFKDLNQNSDITAAWYSITTPENNPESEVLSVNGSAGDPLFGPLDYHTIPAKVHMFEAGDNPTFEAAPWSLTFIHITHSTIESNSESTESSLSENERVNESSSALNSSVAELESSSIYESSEAKAEITSLADKIQAIQKIQNKEPVSLTLYSVFGEVLSKSLIVDNTLLESEVRDMIHSTLLIRKAHVGVLEISIQGAREALTVSRFE
ncbi:MAG: hypothetical protein OCD01_04650 [Fibrobacterales bacterium]